MGLVEEGRPGGRDSGRNRDPRPGHDSKTFWIDEIASILFCQVSTTTTTTTTPDCFLLSFSIVLVLLSSKGLCVSLPLSLSLSVL